MDFPASRIATYKVTVYYKEPTYELATGSVREPYIWICSVLAVDAEDAQRLALREFDETARLSGVGWARHVVQVATERQDDAGLGIAL